MESNTFRDLYEVLELPPDASFKDIKQRFRKLSLELHPDKNRGSPDIEKIEKKYELVTLAYSILSVPETRREYDQMYYIQNRVSKTHDQLKNEYKSYQPQTRQEGRTSAESAHLRDEFFDQKHQNLKNMYQVRTLESILSEREFQNNLTPVPQDGFDEAKQIQVSNQPCALVPSGLDRYQDIDKLGDMFNNGNYLPNYVLGVSESLYEERDIAEEKERYENETKLYKDMPPTAFKTTGDLILDKIILH